MKGHDIALWSAAAAFFATLLAEGIFDVINPDQGWDYLAAIIVAFITGGSIYAKQRLDEAKKEEELKSKPTTLNKGE